MSLKKLWKKSWKPISTSILIVIGVIFLFQQAFFDWGAGDSIKFLWWLALLLIVTGVFIEFKFDKKKWSRLFSRQHFYLALSLFFEVLAIYFFTEFIKEYLFPDTLRLFLTTLIFFFLSLYVRNMLKT